MQCKGCDRLLDIYDTTGKVIAHEWHATTVESGEYICHRWAVVKKATEVFDKEGR